MRKIEVAEDAATVLKPTLDNFVRVCDRFVSILERVERFALARYEESVLEKMRAKPKVGR